MIFRDLIIGTICIAWPLSGAIAQQTPANQPNNVGTPPETEIYLADIIEGTDGLSIQNVQNVTNKTGYDNQPYFTPDGQSFLFVSEGANARMDIWKYHLTTKEKEQITKTPNNSEYSPRLMPDGSGYSVIHEKENRGGQQVWHYPFGDGTAGKAIINISPVGYYAWGLGTKYLAVFALGNPSTLRLIDRESQKEEIIFENIGRALYALPDASGYMFTERKENTPLIIHHLNIATRTVEPVFELPGENEHYALMIDKNTKYGVRFIAADKNKLFSRKIGEDRWTVIANLGVDGLNNMTRLAISDDGEKIAIVNRE